MKYKIDKRVLWGVAIVATALAVFLVAKLDPTSKSGVTSCDTYGSRTLTLSGSTCGSDGSLKPISNTQKRQQCIEEARQKYNTASQDPYLLKSAADALQASVNACNSEFPN